MPPRRRTTTRRANPLAGRLAKQSARVAAISRRTRQEAMKREEMILSLGSAALLGYAKKKAWSLPTIGGIEPSILYGLVLGVGGPMISKDKNGRRLEAMGTGLLTIAAYNVSRTGNFTVSGTDHSMIAGDVEIVGDDDFELMGDELMGDELDDEDSDLPV